MQTLEHDFGAEDLLVIQQFARTRAWKKLRGSIEAAIEVTKDLTGIPYDHPNLQGAIAGRQGEIQAYQWVLDAFDELDRQARRLDHGDTTE